MNYKIERKMVRIKLDEFTKQVDSMMSMVEKGKTFVITREGKPFAEILPLRGGKKNWKRNIQRVDLPVGVSTQTFIEEERNLK